jgi:hypothetical protein
VRPSGMAEPWPVDRQVNLHVHPKTCHFTVTDRQFDDGGIERPKVTGRERERDAYYALASSENRPPATTAMHVLLTPSQSHDRYAYIGSVGTAWRHGVQPAAGLSQQTPVRKNQHSQMLRTHRAPACAVNSLELSLTEPLSHACLARGLLHGAKL